MIRRLAPTLLCVLCVLCGPQTVAEFPTTQPYPRVTFNHDVRTEPPLSIFAVKVDLSDTDVSVVVAPGGEDPDGPDGPWETTLDTTLAVAERENFDIAINGDFFAVETVIDPETGKRKGYHRGQSATVIGPAVTDGRVWSGSERPRAVLMILDDGRAVVAETNQPPADVRQVISGSHIIVRHGQIPPLPDTPFSTTRHPRTAVGTADDGRTLVLVVVDGRRPDASVGMSLAELAELMRSLGCEDAVNLDGGGSTTLVMRNTDTGELEVMNHPSDGRPRAVANVLGVRVEGEPLREGN